MNVARLIIDYAYFCERRGQVLDSGEFAVVWRIANEIAEETAPADREVMLAGILPDRE